MASSMFTPASHPFSTQPLTGRADLQALLLSLLRPLLPKFSPARARVRIGATATCRDEIADQLEGFARPLWGLASLLACDGWSTNPEVAAMADYWVAGLKAGTDPQSPEFWGEVEDVDQHMVEMCPIGYALALAPGVFWARLSEAEKGNVRSWLGRINEKRVPDTNWLWFRVFANLGLKQNGVAVDEARMEADLDHLDTFYRAGGWSNDGPDDALQMDYYSGSFAIQVSQLIYAKVAGGWDPKRAGEYRERARLFALDFMYYFDAEGRAMPFGRSLTYRFAMAAFWGALPLSSTEPPAPLTWGHVRGFLFRNLRWWQGQPSIFAPDGTLTIGYTYPSMFLSENYNSPGSPYWALLAFLSLAVPETHPFWRTAEDPHLPWASSARESKSLPHPSHIAVLSPEHTYLLSTGQKCHYPVRAGAAKYCKYAYSTTFGYSVPTGSYSLASSAPDSTLSLSIDDGLTWRAHDAPQHARIVAHPSDSRPVLVSTWRPWPGVAVTTWLIPPAPESPAWHIRLHRVRTNRVLRTAEGGFAAYGQRAGDGRDLRGFNPSAKSDREGHTGGPGQALAVALGGGGVASAIVDLSLALGIGAEGEEGEEARMGTVLPMDPNANLIHPRTVVPLLEGTVGGREDDKERWMVTGVFAMEGEERIGVGEWRRGWEEWPLVPGWAMDLACKGGVDGME